MTERSAQIRWTTTPEVRLDARNTALGCPEALSPNSPRASRKMLARMRNSIPGAYDKAYR